MNSIIKINDKSDDSSCFVLFYRPIVENPDDFRKRFETVQQLVAQMIFMGRKKGRPSRQEEYYEAA